ncbi:MAG: flagellar export protein FliJ [Gallionellaceae bacterium]|nr:flagellar export protein FliJ [Gallionellaceae bacterium]
MPTRFPLQTLLDHARHRMEAAERLLLMIRRKEDAARLKHEELDRYRREYMVRLSGNSQGGMDIQMLRDFHVFLGKLDQAIRNQAAEVERMHSRWQAAHENWLALRQKVKSFEVLEGRHQRAELWRQDRLDQRQSDELSSRKAAIARMIEREG